MKTTSYATFPDLPFPEVIHHLDSFIRIYPDRGIPCHRTSQRGSNGPSRLQHYRLFGR